MLFFLNLFASILGVYKRDFIAEIATPNNMIQKRMLVVNVTTAIRIVCVTVNIETIKCKIKY